MYISEVRELPSGPDWAYEAKLDGYRRLAEKTGASISCGRDAVLYSRLDFRRSRVLARSFRLTL